MSNVKRGCWIQKSDGKIYCSVCKKVALGKMETWDVMEGCSTSYTYVKSKCCPHCGAIMDVVNNSPLFNLDKTMEFKVVGDIKPIIRQILGEYEEWESSDCAVHLKGAPGISLPGYYPRLTYYACFAKPKCRLIIAQLYEEGLIELHCVRD